MKRIQLFVLLLAFVVSFCGVGAVHAQTATSTTGPQYYGGVLLDPGTTTTSTSTTGLPNTGAGGNGLLSGVLMLTSGVALVAGGAYFHRKLALQ